MDKFDIKDAKPLTVLGVILIVFVMAIANAYKYLPEQADNMPNVNTEMNLPGDEDDTQVQSEENEAQEDTDQTTEEVIENKRIRLIGTEPTEKGSEPELIPLENITENDTAESIQADVETYESVMLNAKKLTSEKKLVDALSEYKKAAALAKTSTEKATCYEEISMIFAKAKKYGTALSYAQRAYNISPNTSREILLARLYYKTGATDKASDKVNDILRRDFSQD